MSYISHVKNESRMFDCMYDPAYIVSGEADMAKATRTALHVSAPIGVSPIFNLMFSDLPANCRQNTWKAVNPLPTPSQGILPFQRLSGGYDSKAYKKYKAVDCCGTKRANYFHYPTNLPQVINVQFEPEKPVIKKMVEEPRIKTKSLQTMFRESSMQTLPFEPETFQCFKDLEINTVASFIAPTDKIGLFEVRTIMRARRRRNYEECLSKIHTFKNKHEGLLILEAFEWEEWIAREEDIYNCQILRMELVQKAFVERNLKTQSSGNSRIIRETLRISEDHKRRLLKNNKDLARDLRKLKDKHSGRIRCVKEEFIESLNNPASNYQAPQMKLGVLGNRRHFLPRRKRFDDRIGVLEEKIKNSGYSLDCPLVKLKKISAPKERVNEIQKGFQNEENLKNLWEDMRQFRQKSVIERRPSNVIKIKDPVQFERKSLFPKQHVEYQTEKMEIKSLRSKVEIRESSIAMKSHASSQCSTHRDIITENQLFEERNLNETIKQEQMINQIFAEYEGQNIGWMMKFLEEELARLFEERRIHAFAMLAEKERQKLEAAEAGYRQKENKRRDEQELIYQSANTTRKTMVNEYLEKLIQEEYEIASNDDAARYIEIISQKIAKEASQQVRDDVAKYESLNPKLMQDTVKDFLIPEIYKRVDRKKKQKMLETRYNTLDSLIDGILQKHFGQPSPYEETLIIVIEMLDLLIDNTVMAFEASETSSEEDEAKYEAKMAIKKILRSFCPKRNWKTSTERIAEATVDEMLSAVMEDFQAAQQSGSISEKLSEILASFSQAYTTSSTESGETNDLSPVISESEIPNKLGLFVCGAGEKNLSGKSAMSVHFKEPIKHFQEPITGGKSLRAVKSKESIFDFDDPKKAIKKATMQFQANDSESSDSSEHD